MKAVNILTLLFLAVIVKGQAPTTGLTPASLNVVGVDQFGRSFTTIGGYKPNKQVGIFYWPWIGQPYATGVYDATKIMAMPDGLKLLYDFKFHDAAISPNGQAHFWGEPIWGYYNSEDEWVTRRQMKMLAMAGVDFIVFDLTNHVTYKPVYEKVLRIIEDYQSQGWKMPKAVFYTHSKSMETTRILFKDLYKPGLYPNAWYYVNGKPMIIAYTKADDDIAEAKSRNDTTYSPAPYSKEILDFFYFKKPQWPFDPTYPDGFPWVEWTFPQPLHGGVMSVTVASHPKVPMSRSLTSGWINWGRGWDPATKQNIKEDVDKGTFFQRQWDHAIEADPDTVFVGGWNEWIAYKQPYGDEYMLCDAASREYSRDIEPMKGGYEDAFYIQLIKNIHRYKGVNNIAAGSKKTIDISGNIAQWADVKSVYKNVGSKEYPRNNYGVSKTVFYKQQAPQNNLQEIKLANDDKNVYFFIRAEKEFLRQENGKGLTVYIGRGEPSLKGWNGYEYIIKENSKTGNFEINKLDASYKTTPAAKLSASRKGNIIQLKIPRQYLSLNDAVKQFYFKVTDGVEQPNDIMSTYLTGSAMPMGRLSYLYSLTN